MTKLQKKIYRRKWYLKNKKRIYLYNKQYIKKHKNRFELYTKRYRKLHKKKLIIHSTKCKQCNKVFIWKKIYRKYCSRKCVRMNKNISMKIWKQNNKKHVYNYTKKYRQRKIYKDWIVKYKKEYYQKNKNRINDYVRLRRKKDLNNRIKNNLSSCLRRVLRGMLKSSKTMKLLGCSIEFLKSYLEARFKKGMSWENYGNGWNGKGMKEWHIDHIKPCISFNLRKISEQRKCFHYTNLQPLWAKENLRKNKY